MKPKQKHGRPSKYTPAMDERARKYLESCVDEHVMIPVRGSDEMRMRFKVELPSIAGLAVYLGIPRMTVTDWGKNHDTFSVILQEILAEQEKRLLNSGLNGEYNAHIAKLALGKHGYSDKQDLTHDVAQNLAELMREDDTGTT